MRPYVNALVAAVLGLAMGVVFSFTPLASDVFRLFGGQGYDGWERITVPFLFGPAFGLAFGVLGFVVGRRSSSPG